MLVVSVGRRYRSGSSEDRRDWGSYRQSADTDKLDDVEN